MGLRLGGVAYVVDLLVQLELHGPPQDGEPLMRVLCVRDDRHRVRAVLEGGHGGLRALEHHHFGGLEEPFQRLDERVEGLVVDQHAPARLGHISSSHVHVCADACEVSAVGGAHGAAEDVAGGDSDGDGVAESRHLFGNGRGTEDGSGAIVGVGEGGHPPHCDEHAALVVHQELSQEPPRLVHGFLRHEEEGLQGAGVLVAHRGVAVQPHEQRADLAQLPDEVKGLRVDRVQHRPGHEL
mmetsp:Transcript_2311/g.5424  ORF Transcript_2311/g.5424 Transcript_2311/m.5424 type:complete len:239 (+) Transcript_2311:910-1626(+)